MITQKLEDKLLDRKELVIKTRLHEHITFLTKNSKFSIKLQQIQYDQAMNMYTAFAMFTGYIPSIKIKKKSSELQLVQNIIKHRFCSNESPITEEKSEDPEHMFH